MTEVFEIPPALPPKDVPSSLRVEAQRQRRGGPSEWRNSLVAVNDETGSIIGILAKGVVLSQDEETEEEHPILPSSDEDEAEEALTPTAQLDYGAAHIYSDPHVRPPSRANSILREDTFAPPPIPSKPDHLRAEVKIDTESFISSHSMNEDNRDIVNGQIRVSALHAEAHRPDLMRDASSKERVEEEYDSDASGSTVGGPVVQIWRKARGGKEAEAKRKAKKEAKKVRSKSKDAKVQPESTKLPSSNAHPAAGPSSGAQIASQKTKGPGYWLHATNKSVMSRHLPGTSVLLEFLAGSRIGASVIKSATPHVSKQRSRESLRDPSVFTPTSIASVPQTGMMAYIPVLPGHLLWYFGMGEGAVKDASKAGQRDERGLAVMGEDLLAMAKALSPAAMLGLASSSATALWSSVADWSVTATSWFDSGLSMLPWAATHSDLERVEPGDDDAEEWEWAIPNFDSTSISSTPRAVYRRKKLNPSMQGHFGQSSYSIVHFDSLGIARRALTRRHQDFAV